MDGMGSNLLLTHPQQWERVEATIDNLSGVTIDPGLPLAQSLAHHNHSDALLGGAHPRGRFTLIREQRTLGVHIAYLTPLWPT